MTRFLDDVSVVLEMWRNDSPNALSGVRHIWIITVDLVRGEGCRDMIAFLCHSGLLDYSVLASICERGSMNQGRVFPSRYNPVP